MKSYGQRCPVARALDRIGERWTLLVIRELMLGPRRYTDLLDGLPGVGTNILAARLADLQEAALVTKQTLPPPTAVTVYELTDAGRALGPALQALREWGEQYGAPATDTQAIRPGWILQSVARRGTLLPAGRSCEIRVGRDVFELAAGDDGMSLTAAPGRSPDAVLTLEPKLLYALASGHTTPRAARERMQIEGDKRLAANVLAALGGVTSSGDS